MSKRIISCQVWEWYGSEDFTEGRYKAKGGQQFIFDHTPATEALDEDELIEKFNSVFNRNGRWYMYEAQSIDYYFEPLELSFADGEFALKDTY
jgi:hypothetical protein